MLSDTHTTKYSIICALLCAAGPSVLGCSADDTGVSSGKQDAAVQAGGASGAGNSSTTMMSSGASGSGLAGSLGTGGATTGSGGNAGSGNAGMSGAAGAGGMDCTLDSDQDGTPDCMDECAFDKLKTKAGVCGCGSVDNASGDVSGDGGIDCIPGHYYEAEKGTLSSSDAGAAFDGGASGAFTIGDDPTASGGKYIVSPSGLDDVQSGPAHASYTITVPDTGQYVIWGHFYAPTLDSNRIWVRVDNGTYQKVRGTTGDTWHWYVLHVDVDWNNPILFSLTKGDHTLDIANDTPGTKIDRFYVTSSVGDTPKPGASDDTVCNPPHTVKMGANCAQSCGMLQGNSCDAVMCAGKTLLPAYDCTICCNTGSADAGAE